MIRIFCYLFLFFLSSCATKSFEDVRSKEYGLVVYRIFSNYPSAGIELERSYAKEFGVDTVGSDHKEKELRTLESLKKETPDLNKNKNYYYKMMYLKVGSYPLILKAELWDKEVYNTYSAALNGCVNIKGGAINYIGDYWWNIGQTHDYASFSEFLSQKRQYDTSIFFKDNKADAKNYMSKYYPEYKAPFVSSFLSQSCCKKVNE